jgi:hypothetical protein
MERPRPEKAGGTVFKSRNTRKIPGISELGPGTGEVFAEFRKNLFVSGLLFSGGGLVFAGFFR